MSDKWVERLIVRLGSVITVGYHRQVPCIQLTRPLAETHLRSCHVN